VKKVRDWLWLFPSEKGSSLMSSWFLSLDNALILIDCPKATEEVINDLKELSGGICPKVVLTNRDAHHDASILNRKLGWPLIVQEQEAYLLPLVDNLITFSEELTFLQELGFFGPLGQRLAVAFYMCHHLGMFCSADVC